VLVDERRPDVGGVGVLGDVIEHEGFECPRCRDGDLDEEVVASGDDEHGQHVVESGHHVTELFDGLPRLRLEPHGDDGLHAATHCFEVDLGVVAADHSLLLEAPDSVMTGRVGDAELAGDLPVATPCVCPKRSDDCEVCPIKFHSRSLHHRNISEQIASIPKNTYNIGVDTEIRTDLPTRKARLKWVIVVNAAVGPGFIANAAACVAAAVGYATPGLLGRGGQDASGQHHPGLPWAGCSILAGDEPILREVRNRAVRAEGLFVVDMPQAAQTNRVYDDYLTELAKRDAAFLNYYAVSIVGPRNTVDKLVGNLPLFGVPVMT
jgi:hypothetical protein